MNKCGIEKMCGGLSIVHETTRTIFVEICIAWGTIEFTVKPCTGMS